MQNYGIVISIKHSTSLPIESMFWFGLPNGAGIDSYVVDGRLDVACPGQNSSLLKVTASIKKCLPWVFECH